MASENTKEITGKLTELGKDAVIRNMPELRMREANWCWPIDNYIPEMKIFGEVYLVKGSVQGYLNMRLELPSKNGRRNVECS